METILKNYLQIKPIHHKTTFLQILTTLYPFKSNLIILLNRKLTNYLNKKIWKIIYSTQSIHIQPIDIYHILVTSY